MPEKSLHERYEEWKANPTQGLAQELLPEVWETYHSLAMKTIAMLEVGNQMNDAINEASQLIKAMSQLLHKCQSYILIYGPRGPANELCDEIEEIMK